MQHIPEALTFDDVLLVPGYSQVLPHEVSLKTQLTRDISLNIPLLSAAMDTVTEAPLAIRLAEAGGVGIIHKNMSIERQALEISKVKKYESGIIKDPVTVKPDTKLAEVVAIAKANQFSGMPVVDGDQLVGIITSRDMRFETNLEQPVKNLMTPQERLVTVREGATRDEVIHLFKKHRIEKVLIVDEQFALKGMMTVKDILKSEQNPSACKDSEGQLRVGAAVGVRANTLERVTALVTAGVDVVAVDTAHGFTKSVIDTVKLIRQHFPHLPLIAGNVATAEGAEALITAGADGIKVGMGPGSICTTRIIAGIGVPQITAVHDVAQIAAKQNIPVIADGGIRFSGDICKAIAAGASTVMIGSLFAGTEEAPGEVVLYKGRSYKAYRGMGSVGAMVSGSSDRYFQVDQEENQKYVPEGIEGRVPYKGPLMAMVHQLTGGIRASMGYTGCETIEEMRTKARFVRISNAGIVESHVHDVFITKEAPNYQRGDVKE